MCLRWIEHAFCETSPSETLAAGLASPALPGNGACGCMCSGSPHVPDMPKEYRPVAPMEAAGRYFLGQIA
jgi:hypothetical protein